MPSEIIVEVTPCQPQKQFNIIRCTKAVFAAGAILLDLIRRLFIVLFRHL